MTAPLPRRLRVVVMGNSSAMYVRPRRRHRDDGTYSEVLERLLRRRGLDAEVSNEARWFEMVNEAFGRYQETVHAHAPDVVVLHYGNGECQPRFIPTVVVRHLTAWHTSLHPVGHWYRRVVVARISRFLSWFMPRIGSRIGQRTWRLAPRRFRNELMRLVHRIRLETGGLVVLVVPSRPGPMMTKLIPDFAERSHRYGEIIRRVAEELDDPDVRVVDPGPVVEALGWRKAMTDGLHFTAEAHSRVAEVLEEEVLAWAQRTVLDGVPGNRGREDPHGRVRP